MHCNMSNLTLTRFNEWHAQQLELNGVSDSKNLVKVCTSHSMYLSHVTCSTGSYNKVFALGFDNGSEAIAHIPCPLAGPLFLTTASEVATLEFMQDVLGICAPCVFAWSADASTNPVSAKYIIMEKILGVESNHHWTHLVKGPEVFPLLDGVFDIEHRFECASFSQIGSLYFRDDVSVDLWSCPLFCSGTFPDDDPELFRKLDTAKDKYCIGPIADLQWWWAE